MGGPFLLSGEFFHFCEESTLRFAFIISRHVSMVSCFWYFTFPKKINVVLNFPYAVDISHRMGSVDVWILLRNVMWICGFVLMLDS